MWWSRQTAAALLALSLAGLAGCGFRPLYGQRGSGQGVVPEFAQVSIMQPDTRTDQEFRNTLLDMLTPEGSPEQPRYLLEYKITESVGSVFVTRSETVTRSNLQVSVSYYLRDYQTGQYVVSGGASSQASFNQTVNDYANLVAERDARARALRDTAEQVRIRLANYFDRWRELRQQQLLLQQQQQQTAK
ncbi:MAG TPA: LPS assembly lipoprotein LptE [Ferrovibrio sp.]|jgi:LPS-assembly lipoprotein|uniref:LPS assembly lipoprotein LptE n=1 Tax=Ferrovibrio sp. TaxID=1917215 RepID=UPI002ED5A0CC